jgi:hypothetical protein
MRCHLPINGRASPVKVTGEYSIAIYTSEAIESTEEVSLTRGGLILIGLLQDGDYDTVIIFSVL